MPRSWREVGDAGTCGLSGGNAGETHEATNPIVMRWPHYASVEVDEEALDTAELAVVEAEALLVEAADTAPEMMLFTVLKAALMSPAPMAPKCDDLPDSPDIPCEPVGGLWGFRLDMSPVLAALAKFSDILVNIEASVLLVALLAAVASWSEMLCAVALNSLGSLVAIWLSWFISWPPLEMLVESVPWLWDRISCGVVVDCTVPVPLISPSEASWFVPVRLELAMVMPSSLVNFLSHRLH
jgi:hypothetical protein